MARVMGRAFWSDLPVFDECQSGSSGATMPHESPGARMTGNRVGPSGVVIGRGELARGKRVRAKAVFAAALVGLVLAALTGVASAKVLPVTDLRIATRHPSVDAPVRIVLRLAPGSGLGGHAITHGEVVLLRAERADAQGWPLDRRQGTSVVVHRVGDGIFRGSFVVHRAGSYVVFARSSFYAYEMQAENVQNVPQDLPPPIRLEIRKK